MQLQHITADLLHCNLLETADHLPSSHLILSVVLHHTNSLHVLLHSIHKPCGLLFYQQYIVQYIHYPLFTHVQTISALPLKLCPSDVFISSLANLLHLL